MFRRAAIVCALVSSSFAIACGAGSKEPSDTVESDATSVEPGMHVLEGQWNGDKASAVAVKGATAYVGLGTRGVAVVDTKTFETKRRIERDGENKRIPADQVQVEGKKLVTFGLRDDAPLEYGAGADYNFVVSVLDPSSGAVEKQVRVHLMGALSDPRESLFDIPTCAGTLRDGRVYLMVAHERASEVVSFELPEQADASLELGDLLADSELAVEYGKSVTVHDGAAFVPEPEGRDDGYVRKIDLASGAAEKIGSKLGYPVAVAFAGSAMMVADHSGNLFAVDPSSGETLAQIEVPDWVTGVTVAGANVFVSTWSGLFVAKNEWR